MYYKDIENNEKKSQKSAAFKYDNTDAFFELASQT